MNLPFEILTDISTYSDSETLRSLYLTNRMWSRVVHTPHFWRRWLTGIVPVIPYLNNPRFDGTVSSYQSLYSRIRKAIDSMSQGMLPLPETVPQRYDYEIYLLNRRYPVKAHVNKTFFGNEITLQADISIDGLGCSCCRLDIPDPFTEDDLIISYLGESDRQFIKRDDVESFIRKLPVGKYGVYKKFSSMIILETKLSPGDTDPDLLSLGLVEVIGR